MKLRTKLAIFSVTVLAGSVGVLAWRLDRFVRQQVEREQRQQSDTLVTRR